MYEPSASAGTIFRPLSQRRDGQGGTADLQLHRLLRVLRLGQFHWLRKRRFEREFSAALEVIETLTRDQRADQIAVLRTTALRGSEAYSAVVLALAMASSTALQLGQRVSLEQAAGAWSCLLGAVVVLDNDEDRSWALALAAAAGALLGFPVQLMHATSHLSREFHEKFVFLFAGLNLRLGMVSESLRKAERSAQYSCDVVLGTPPTDGE